MMKATITYQSLVLFLLLAGGLLTSCNDKKDVSSSVFEKYGVIASRQVVNGDTVMACDVSLTKEPVELPLSLLIDTLEVIKLDQKEEALVGRGWITVSDNYLGISESGSAYKLFTRQGQFVCNVGGVGQGPGEYRLIYSSQLDEANGRIYLLPWQSQEILSYDMQGNFVESIPLPYRVPKGSFQVNPAKRQVTVVQLAFMDSPVAWVQDWEGNIIHENRSPQMSLQPDFSNEVSVYKRGSNFLDFSIMRAMPTTDSLYSYRTETNKLVPLFTANFSGDIPFHTFTESSNYYITQIYGPNPDPKIMRLTVVNRIIVDKQTLKGGQYKMVNDFLGGISLEEVFSEYDYTLCMEPSSLLELIEERLTEDISSKDRDFLNAWKNDISEDDNSYVIIGKAKN